MAERRLLITGGSGLLALNWACARREAWRVVLGTHRHGVRLAGVDSRPLELEHPDRLGHQLDELAPDVVVHAAALTGVDQCEADPDRARHVNAELARNVAAATAARGIRLLHISTDHLFDGRRSGYREDDAPAPLNQYARSKLLGEELCFSYNRHFAVPVMIIRPFNIYGPGQDNRYLIPNIIRTAAAGVSNWMIRIRDAISSMSAMSLNLYLVL